MVRFLLHKNGGLHDICHLSDDVTTDKMTDIQQKKPIYAYVLASDILKIDDLIHVVIHLFA